MADWHRWDITDTRTIEYIQELNRNGQKIYVDFKNRTNYAVLQHSVEYGWHTRLQGNKIFVITGLMVRENGEGRITSRRAVGLVKDLPVEQHRQPTPRRRYRELEPPNLEWSAALNKLSKQELIVVKLVFGFFAEFARLEPVRAAELLGRVEDSAAFIATLQEMLRKYEIGS